MVIQGKRYRIVKGRLQECKPPTLGQKYWNNWGHLERLYPQTRGWTFWQEDKFSVEEQTA
jgi:hypothetical protein